MFRCLLKAPKAPRPSCERSKLSGGRSLAALTANLGGYRPNAPKDLFAARECGGEGRLCGHCRRLLKHGERDGALEFLQNFNIGTFPGTPEPIYHSQSEPVVLSETDAERIL